MLTLCQLSHRTFRYARRTEKGVQSPGDTLKLRTGSCRDLATLMMDAARAAGVASRFVSGYVHGTASMAGHASTHAWTEVYLPTLGWRGFDPTSGDVVAMGHIATGVSSHPRGVMPISGSFTGAGNDYLGVLHRGELDGQFITTLSGGAGKDQLYTDVKSTLVSEMLTKVDRMTMASGLEARVPFLDHHLLEWAFQIPSGYKMRGREGKLVVKKAMERYLPSELLYRPKHGFNVPMPVWMRGELREFVQDSLAEETVKRRGLFRPDRVTRLVQDHLAGRTDASNRILVLLMMELWFERFVDRRAELYPAGA